MSATTWAVRRPILLVAAAVGIAVFLANIAESLECYSGCSGWFEVFPVVALGVLYLGLLAAAVLWPRRWRVCLGVGLGVGAAISLAIGYGEWWGQRHVAYFDVCYIVNYTESGEAICKARPTPHPYHWFAASGLFCLALTWLLRGRVLSRLRRRPQLTPSG